MLYSDPTGLCFCELPQSLRPAIAKPLRVSARSLSPFGLEMLTSQLNGGRSERRILYFYQVTLIYNDILKNN